MDGVTIVTRGERETSLRFDKFPSKLTARLEQKIRDLTEMLDERIEAVTPKKTGLLRSEITPKVYTGDNGDRVAGYVSVFAGDRAKEYAKAATLEYGTDKPRRIPDHGGVFRKLGRGQKRIESRLTRPARTIAFRFLRQPFEQMQPEIIAGLEEAVAETVAEDEA
jgi:hypothetical protein